MNKKQIIVISSILIALIITVVTLMCFFMIPRVCYGYDKTTDTYYVESVFGNEKKYVILNEIKSKPVTKIKARAFMNKTNLEEIVLGDNLAEIERLSFKDCKNLKQIDLKNVKTIGRNAFEGCTSLTKIEIFVNDIAGGTFAYCSSLKEIILFNTLSIGSMAFAYTAIESITIPFYTYLIGVDAFLNCNNLNEIVVESKYLFTNEYLNSLNYVKFVGN